jgi:anti-anti-sigma regulatory factor
LRIEKHSQRGKATIRLIGRFQVEHIEELQKQIEQNRSQVVLDLTELTLVDLDVIRFLGSCEASGVKLVNCSPYVREWMNQEGKM